jgi:hypothetical protein
MSLFQNVWIEINCEYCNKLRKTNVRFHGSAYLVADYELGEKVPKEDDLDTEEIYEANADRYCWDCLFEWSLENANAGYEILIHCVKQGIVEVKLSKWTPSLSVDEILVCKKKYIDELKDRNMRIISPPFYKEFYLTFNGKLVRNKDLEENLTVWSEFLDVISPLHEQYLKNKNWHTETWKDYIVYLEKGTRRILVKDIYGNKLFK